jgi:zinc transporter ZupT
MYIHRFATSIVLGYLILQDQGSKMRKLFYMVLYSISTSLGLAFGMILVMSRFNTGILLSIAAGSLLYICVSDILVKEFNLKSSNWKKFVCLLSGMATENFLWFFELYQDP